MGLIGANFLLESRGSQLPIELPLCVTSWVAVADFRNDGGFFRMERCEHGTHLRELRTDSGLQL